MSRAHPRPAGNGTPITHLNVHVQPRAKRTEVVGWYGDAVKVRLAALPVSGAANEALVAFLAAELGVARSSVKIVAGRTSRHKHIAIPGMTREVALDRLGLQ